MILNVYKEKGWTSLDVVAKVRGILRTITGNKKIKVGHAGTLDPLAEGVLLVLTESDTKKQDQFMGMPKEYIAKIELGKESDTYDLEGEVRDRSVKDFDLTNYVGTYSQTVPPYSAVKVGGQPLYKKARSKQEIDQLPSREVTVYSIEELSRKQNTLTLKINCAKGFYVRSLANDLGGVLLELTRTKVGEYESKDAVRVSQLEELLRA